MARLDDALINSVFYIYPDRQSALSGEKSGGGGFLIGVKILSDLDYYFIYAVSNSHIISQYNHPVLRINTKDGGISFLDSDSVNWIRHPQGDDVSILPISIDPNEYEFNIIPQTSLISQDIIKEHNIGSGDEVYLIGRFVNREETGRNKPTVRKGIISSIEIESIYNPDSQFMQESLLIEIHSISGYSGSPAFLIIEPFSPRPDKTFISNIKYWWLLGIDWGHSNIKGYVRDDDGKIIGKEYVLINTSICQIIPSWKIQEILDLDELASVRNKWISNYQSTLKSPK